MMSRLKNWRWLTLAVCAALLLSFLVVSWQYGPQQRKLRADPSIMLYVGQQILRGNPPYATVTIVKTPMTGILAAGAIATGRALGWTDVFAARAGFMVLGGLLVVVTFLCGAALFSRTAGLFAALALLGMDGVSQRVTDGPSPKVPFILFGIAALWLTARKQWFWAGVAAVLSFLTWQPGAAFLIVVWVGAFLTARSEWKRALGQSLAGIVTPLLFVGLYLGLSGALDPALKQVFAANASYLNSSKVGAGILNVVRENITNVTAQAPQCFRDEQLFLALGVAGMLGIAAFAVWWWRKSTRDGETRFFEPALLMDSLQGKNGFLAPLFLYAPLLLSAGALFAFTLVDFQSCADVLPFFPYLALGIGWVAALGITLLTPRIRTTWFAPAAAAFVCVLLLAYGLADVVRGTRATGLEQQHEMASRIAAQLGADDDIQQFGDAVLLVLLQRENATRFIHLGDKQGAGILRAEGVPPEQLPNLIATQHPRMITLSRAKDQPWAEPLYDWIAKNYTRVEGYDAQSGGTPQVTEIYIANDQ